MSNIENLTAWGAASSAKKLLKTPNIINLSLSPGQVQFVQFDQVKALAFNARLFAADIDYSFDGVSYIVLPKEQQYWINNLNKWAGKIYFKSNENCIIDIEYWN